jgi:hypothetical protein
MRNEAARVCLTDPPALGNVHLLPDSTLSTAVMHAVKDLFSSLLKAGLLLQRLHNAVNFNLIIGKA